MEIAHSEYVSPCSPVVLQRWGHETKQDPEGEGERVYMGKSLEGSRAKLQRSDSGLWGCKKGWFGRSGNDTSDPFGEIGEIQVDLPQREGESETCVVFPLAVLTLDPDVGSIESNSISRTPTTAVVSASASAWPSRAGSLTPYTSTCNPSTPFLTLFSHFPRTHIAIGTAERLTREVASLICAMEKDGVEVNAQWVKDACHDVLMVPPSWWDKSVVEGAWNRVGEWARTFRD